MTIAYAIHMLSMTLHEKVRKKSRFCDRKEEKCRIFVAKNRIICMEGCDLCLVAGLVILICYSCYLNKFCILRKVEKVNTIIDHY